MISIVGIGNGASAIADKFAEITQYDVYRLNNSVEENSKDQFYLPAYSTPEEHEQNIPNLKKFFKKVRDHVQVFIVGASYSSNYSLGILEQLRHKKVDVFYIRPDMELISGERRLVEKVTFGVLQEYARSWC